MALMDLHEGLDDVSVGPGERDVIKKVLDSAEHVAATIADSLTRKDRRAASELMAAAVGDVAKTRTHLAVAWGRGLLDDEMFKTLDTKYDSLSSSLQNFR